MPAAAPELSVIVPCRGHARELDGLLGALAAQTLPRDRFEVLVVDDGSEPALTLDRAAPGALDLRCLRQAPAGPAAARNTAIAVARGRVLLFLNADAVPAPDALARHLAAHPPGAATRSVLGRFDFLARHRTPFLVLADRLGTLFPYALLAPGRPLPFHAFWTGNLSVARDAVRAVGGFDASFGRALFEDVELGYRLERAGVPLVFDDAIACGHDHAITLPGWLDRAARIGWEWVRFARLHGGRHFPILAGEDEADEALAGALVAALLHQHEAHAARVAELGARVAAADARVAAGEPLDAVAAELVAGATSLLEGVNTVQRMRGILAHLDGRTLEDLDAHAQALRPFTLVHAIASAADLTAVPRALDLVPRGGVLVATHRHWIAPAAWPADPRLVRLRLGAEEARAPWAALLAASPSEAFVLLGGAPLPTASELGALVRVLAVTPRVGLAGLGARAGHTHALARLTPRVPSHVVAAPRASLTLAAEAGTPAGGLAEAVEARGLALATVVPAGPPR